MTRQRTLSPLTLLLVSLLCYGFVLVWTENIGLETTTIFEDLSTPVSLGRVNVLTGGNLSVSVPPWESTTGSPVGSTQSNFAIKENVTTMIPTDSSTIPLPDTMEDLSTVVPMESTEATTEDEMISDIDITEAALSAIENITGIIEHINKTTELSTHTIATSTGVSTSSGLAAHPRTMKRASSDIHRGDTEHSSQLHGGIESSGASHQAKLTLRVKLQSDQSRQQAITTFFEKACNVIFKNLHMKDIVITGAPGHTTMKCL